jgi:adenine-specific DNA-methyltransferase
MAKKKDKPIAADQADVSDYRFKESKRKNIPPAGLAAHGVTEDVPKQRFYYDPHLPPVLQFDGIGTADKLPELLEKAKRQSLTDEEIDLLANALRKQEPWLEWTGKREKKWFEVDPVALNIHERISTQAILKIAKRENVQRELFADPEMEYREAVKFYKHDMDWANRLILGDSLQVMASLAYRESLAGKVQMIYIDPPYGIKFASNFQPFVGKRDVKDQDNDLTREPEVVKAYRDTWTLGIHSYLAYIKDRLVLAKKLLKDTGSIFVQIGDENVHLIRELLDEVFGRKNFFSQITFKKTLPLGSSGLGSISDYILWYAKDINQVQYNQLYLEKPSGEGTGYTWIREDNGSMRKMSQEERQDLSLIPQNSRIFFTSTLSSSGYTPSCYFDLELNGKIYTNTSKSWRTNPEGMQRLLRAERLIAPGNLPTYIQYHQDFLVQELHNLWDDTHGATDIIYVVQTSRKVIERCLLMTTSPGDLVLDPTSGSGTTAFVAEQWGRRWITIDTSRVAVALARQRLLTAKFEHYRLNDTSGGPGEKNPFQYENVPHITLKSVAQNLSLDPIFEKYDPILEDALRMLNSELKKVPKEVRNNLVIKLQTKQKTEGKKSITDADIRMWKLPETTFEHWDVPFDTDEAYPVAFSKGIENYRDIWQRKMDEVDACIQANAEQVELVDKPEKVNGIVRVAGPFTVEGVMPAEFNMDDTSPIESIDGELETFDVATNAISFIDNIYNLLNREGVNFTGNKHKIFIDLRVYDGSNGFIHFEGEWANGDKQEQKVAVSVGPQHGPVTAWQVEQVIRMAYKRGFDDVVFAGFSFTAEAQATIQDDANPKMRLHLAQIRPDVQMGDLLKNTGAGQVFTVFGSPRVKLTSTKDGQLQVFMEGVDIYDPVANTIVDSKADKVAAWFLDSDYDGRTFCITQAFFPDRDAWKKLEKALKGVIDEDKFEAFSGTVSLPFPIGEHRKAAVKVIDPRGNEVMKVLSLDKKY